jgi:hypothetical protein
MMHVSLTFPDVSFSEIFFRARCHSPRSSSARGDILQDLLPREVTCSKRFEVELQDCHFAPSIQSKAKVFNSIHCSEFGLALVPETCLPLESRAE